jgi:hypothetical protein
MRRGSARRRPMAACAFIRSSGVIWGESLRSGRGDLGRAEARLRSRVRWISPSYVMNGGGLSPPLIAPFHV